jgi:hypothetical protein
MDLNWLVCPDEEVVGMAADAVPRTSPKAFRRQKYEGRRQKGTHV